jgi:hypothetical protein
MHKDLPLYETGLDQLDVSFDPHEEGQRRELRFQFYKRIPES